MAEEVLVADRLCTGDRPSVFVAGMLVAHALRKSKFAVITVNALGQVVLMPQESIKVLAPTLVPAADLDGLSEDEAIEIMTVEGRSDEDILQYLAERHKKGLSHAE